MTTTRWAAQIGALHVLHSIAIALFLLLSGCNLLGREDTPAGDHLHAYFSPGCAPTDGPALYIYLLPEQATCDDLNLLRFSNPPEQSFTFLQLYGKTEPMYLTPQALGSEIDTGFSYSEGGQGVQCRASDKCVSVQQGTITFRQSPEIILDVALRYEDGTRETGRFTAQACEQRTLCG